MTESLRVAVIDDHPLFRTGVTSTLAELGMDVVAEGASSDDAVEIARRHCPDMMLLDISMPGDGLAAIGAVREVNPHIKIVMLTASEDGSHVRKALHLGASGYVLKGVGSRILAEALGSVIKGNNYVPPELTVKLLLQPVDGAEQPVPPATLSARETTIIELLAMGWSNKRIARQLDLQEKTVKHHMTKILAKLGAINRTEAALKWRALSGNRTSTPSVEQRLDP